MTDYSAKTQEAAAGSGNQQEQRRFLFLQGPIGPFFRMLALRLRQSGHGIHRINLNGGDRLFWRLPGAVDYRGGGSGWQQFLRARLEQWRITDIVLFGDCRPRHQAARKTAAALGIPVHVFEEGYLRPNWITLETGGVNRNSSMPRDAAWFAAEAARLEDWDPGHPVPSSFPRRAAEDVIYNLGTVFTAWAYPSYRSHKPWHPLAEYAAGARRFPLKSRAKRRKAEQLGEIAARQQPYYLFPLQLDADSQIRFHSPFGRMAPAIEKVIASFAAHAPRETLLVITEHPLDTGLVPLRRMTLEYAAAAGVAGRVIYLQGGSPDELVRGSRGLITVNSTMGILGLDFGVPVTAMGHAIYDMPGLTFQGPLDTFWGSATPPDAQAFDAFRRVVAVRTQINGGFYSLDALRMAVNGAAQRLQTLRPLLLPAADLRRRAEAPAGAEFAPAWIAAEAVTK